MGLSRLDNFLKNTKGEILYVDPSSLDSTDSVENQGNSLARPFKTIQRALMEAARFSYQEGRENDRFGKTTILLYPGEHIVDNRPGFLTSEVTGTYFTRAGDTTEDLSPLDRNTNFDVLSENNILYKLNSVFGGVIVPRGTSIVGLDLRKTKIRPRYVPDPENDTIERSAIFRLTGACYMWQFSVFDADPNAIAYKDYTTNTFIPNFSHHKLTVFEYADGKNEVNIDDDLLTYESEQTDLDIYYQKIGDVYGSTSGREIEPETVGDPLDIEAKIDEYRIVGSRGAEVGISSIRAGDGETSSSTITVTLTEELDGLDVDTPIQISGVSVNGYTGQFVVSEKNSATEIEYKAPSSPITALPSASDIAEATLTIITDTVTSASPYIFNISLRSVYGTCGMHADGDKADGFKSMVVAQYTGIGLQKDNNAFIKYDDTTGTYEDSATVANLFSDSRARYKPSYENYHIKASNNAVIQIVSVFGIGYAIHFLAESGGDLSITNSNSNFGAKALVARGFRAESFTKDDVGYITHAIPPQENVANDINVEFVSFDVDQTTGVGLTSRLYLYEQVVEAEKPNNVIDGYRVGAKLNDEIKVDIINAGITSTFSAKIVMPGTETSFAKEFTVTKKSNGISNEITSNTFTFTETHSFANGESIRILSDTGHIPDGLINGQVYYAITTGLSGNQIQVAKTLNDALIGQEAVIYSNETSTVKVVSRVSDKSPGDTGHPVQWDSSRTQWYLSTSGESADNDLYGLIVNLTSDATPRSYFTRTPDTRGLLDRIYRLRYVIPKDNPTASRPPIEGYVLQESSGVTGSDVENEKYYSISAKVLNDSTELRNPRFIADATYAGTTATITTELPHNLTVGDTIRTRLIKSAGNADGTDSIGYNGIFFVATVPNKKTFTYTLTTDPGTFTSDPNTRDSNLPYFTKYELPGTYVIYRSEEVQKYVKDEQDGIYHLILLSASNNPTVSPFNTDNYVQPVQFLYPQINKDNPKSDPDSTKSFAESELIGNVVVNDAQKSITKESLTKLYDDINIGIAITDIVSTATTTSTGIAHTLFTEVEHGLNRVTSLSIDSPGAGYGSGSGTVLYNANLVGASNTVYGTNATCVVSIDGAGSLTGIKVMDGGQGYSVGDKLQITGTATTTGFTTATVNVDAIYNNTGDVIYITDIADSHSQYNTLYRITGITTTYDDQIFVESVDTISGINTLGVGITDLLTSKAYNLGPTIGISSLSYNNITGVVSFTSVDNHGLSEDNKIRLAGANNAGYNKDHVITRITGQNTFEVNVGVGTTVPNALGTIRAFRNGFTSRGGLISLADQNIGGRLIDQYGGITAELSAAITSADATTLSITNLNDYDFEIGDYLQINDEIFRIKESVDGNPVTVFRGALGSIRATHASGDVVRKIKPIPMELRRNSIIRASGHTFEYLGYGPGNYSTGLPDRQDRVLDQREVFIAQANKQNGGVVAFTAMDSDGNFFIGNKKLNSTTGREDVFDAPIITITGQDVTTGNEAGFDAQVSSEITITRSLKVEGGPEKNIVSEFDGPTIFNEKITSSSDDGVELKSLFMQGSNKISRKYTNSPSKPTVAGNPGDVVINSQPDSGGTLGWVYTSDNIWEDFGLLSDQGLPLSKNVGITTFGASYAGIATNINFVGIGVSITAELDETVGVGTVTFFSSSVEPEFLIVAGVSTFNNNIISNETLFSQGGFIATTGISTFYDDAVFREGAAVFNGLEADSVTVSGTVVATEVNTTTFTNNTANFAGSISAGSTSDATNRTIKVLSGDNNNAGFEAYGDTQGTGYIQIGSRADRGGGISYNGNLSPSFTIGESADTVTYYRRSGGVNQVVFSYPYNDNTVSFSGDVTLAGNLTTVDVTSSGNASITGSISTVTNINSIGISTLPTINSDTVTVNQKLSILAPVDQNIVSMGSSTVIDCSQGNYFVKTVGAGITFEFANVPSGVVYGATLEITHTAGTISWPSSVKFPENQAPVLTEGKTHLFMFVTDDGGARFRAASLFDFDD
jgi:hypothetical protein